MKKYVQYYHFDLKGEVSPILGSDGVLDLDGRHSLASNLETARANAEFLEDVMTTIGFSIEHGSYSDNHKPEYLYLIS